LHRPNNGAPVFSPEGIAVRYFIFVSKENLQGITTGNWLCLGFPALPRVFYRALGKENLCRELRSAQQYSRHCILYRGSGRRQAGTLGIIKSLPSASPRQGAHRRRRSERRHIWAAVHCADSSAVRPSAQMLPVSSAPSPALGKGVDPGLPRLTGLCQEPAGPSAERRGGASRPSRRCQVH
jgi:hypothetical protein